MCPVCLVTDTGSCCFAVGHSGALRLRSMERGWADVSDGEAIYFCGNSLGLLSKQARQYVMQELDVWSSRSVLFSLIV